MGRRPPDRRLNLRALPAALLLCAVVGCSAPSVPSTDAPNLAARLTSALERHARDDFLGAFAPDPDDQAVGLSWYTVLDAGHATVSLAGDGRLRVDYELAGDRRGGSDVLVYGLDAGTRRIDSLQGAGEPLPLWSLPGVSLTKASSGTLLSASLDAAARERWADRLDRAAKVVRASGVGENWPGGLVVEVPPEGRFSQVTGASATDASAITVCASGTPRIVVNPVILGQADEWLDSTLVHEAVHVATDSACAVAGTSLGWAVEGLAESVAADSDVATASRNRALAVAEVRAHGVPDALPRRLESLTDYALAQIAVDQLRAHLGPDAEDLLRRAIHDAPAVSARELRQVTGWYVAELQRLRRPSSSSGIVSRSGIGAEPVRR